MNLFEESMRYDYPLTTDSWVVDVGAYLGNFSRAIGYTFNCNVLAFEPIRRFWNDAKEQPNAKAKVFNCGVGAATGYKTFQIKGDMTGEFAEGEQEVVSILDIREVVKMVPHPIDLLKINIEGGEYEVLNRLIECDMVGRCKNIQVQFHGCVADCEKKREAIRAELAKTHAETYCYPFVWENWSKK